MHVYTCTVYDYTCIVHLMRIIICETGDNNWIRYDIIMT